MSTHPLIKLATLGQPEKPRLARDAWEFAVIYELIERLNIPNGDAQGIFESQSFKVAQEWAKGSDPIQTARAIDHASRGV